LKFLVIGSGGLEHALCWAIAASPLCYAVWCAPGNAGIAREAQCVPDLSSDDLDGILAFARKQAIDLVIVGPEAPLCAGLVDKLEAAGIKAFGPSAAAAQIEGSKGFMKDLCAKYGVPTAKYRRFRDPVLARAYVAQQSGRVVVKADGLAAGKGVLLPETKAEAVAAVEQSMIKGAFGKAGAEIVIEEFMEGEEASFFVLVDGTTAVPFGTARDHKRVGDGDTGPNTGGMGAYSPAPMVDEAMHERVMAEIINPVVAGLAAEGAPYKGILYAGLMLTAEGPKVIEFNCRLGDPEAQVLLPRLQSDLIPAMFAACDGVLDQFDLRWYDEAAVCVVMASNGYPGAYANGTEIKGLANLAGLLDVIPFHAGTVADGDRVLAKGGRVLGITGLGETIKDATARAYEAVDRIDWPDGFCRRDIAAREA
jgi:phosphoribosylamine---glycine ligase